MKRAGLAGAIALAAATAGCGVYSVRMQPPPTVRSSPLDLSVSLGEVRTVVDGRAVETDAATLAAIDADFVQAANASGIFRRVTFIQRVHTTGGLAPSAPGFSTGAEARVPYTAEYFFYRTE